MHRSLSNKPRKKPLETNMHSALNSRMDTSKLYLYFSESKPRSQITHIICPCFCFINRHLGAKTTQSAAWLPSWWHACARFACGLKCHKPIRCSRGPDGAETTATAMLWKQASQCYKSYLHGCSSQKPDLSRCWAIWLQCSSVSMPWQLRTPVAHIPWSVSSSQHHWLPSNPADE